MLRVSRKGFSAAAELTIELFSNKNLHVFKINACLLACLARLDTPICYHTADPGDKPASKHRGGGGLIFVTKNHHKNAQLKVVLPPTKKTEVKKHNSTTSRF